MITTNPIRAIGKADAWHN